MGFQPLKIKSQYNGLWIYQPTYKSGQIKGNLLYIKIALILDILPPKL